MPKKSAPAVRDITPQIEPESRATWRAWLEKHHGEISGVWLVFRKKSHPEPNLSYADAVEEALCFGWIDSRMNPVDATRYRQWFTPRKPKSGWSALNKSRIEKLRAAGLMMPAGDAAIALAQKTGVWAKLDAVEALEVPAELVKALSALPVAKKNFGALAPANRKMYLHWLSTAKLPATRDRRIATIVRCCALGLRNRQALPDSDRG